MILSNKSGFCHGLRCDPRALHICYCLTPTRYVWQLDEYLAGEGLGALTERLLRPLAAWLRRWDYAAAQRVSHFIAISSAVQARIRKYYQREVDHHPSAGGYLAIPALPRRRSPGLLFDRIAPRALQAH